jgi:hypothetical protein
VASDASRVLVLVKATPQPSRKYGDTVCVAGVDMEAASPKWMRLYPVPFRYLDGEQQFKKYDVIRVRTRAAGADHRPESRKIDAQSLRVERSVKGWESRARWVEPLAGRTMCELISDARLDINAASLAAVRPYRVTGLKFSAHPGWTTDELARFEEYRSQGDLFREAAPRLLDPPRFNVHLLYHCSPTCNEGHEPRIIDWELTALQRRFFGEPDSAVEAAVREKFLNAPFREDRRPLIFVGNQENVRRRASFTVLGLYYPRRNEVPQVETLF